MASVGSTSKVESVDLQAMVHAASAFVRPEAKANPATDTDTEQQASISPLGRLKSATSAVLDAAARLDQAQTWSATKATSSDTSVIQADSDGAKLGEHEVAVKVSATSQTVTSAAFSSLSTVIGIGTLNIEMGTWNGTQTAFATNPNWPKANVTLGPKDTSLERVRDKINAAGVGVVASVLSDSTGSRLVLRATSTGTAHGFKVHAEAQGKPDSDAAKNLAALGFDPSALAGNTGSSLTQAAQDAQVQVNGKDIQSAQNQIEDPDSGLRLSIKSASQSKVKINVERDPDAAHADIKALAHAYNALQTQNTQQTHADAQIDAVSLDAANDIQRRVQNIFNPSSGQTSPLAKKLQDIGVDLDHQGQLSVDDQRLSQALRDKPDQVESLFKGVNTRTPHESGLAHQLLGKPTPHQAAVDDAARSDKAKQEELSAAGALFRKKLLTQQYVQVDEPSSSTTHKDDLRIHTNVA
ncbi:MAG: flagellar filament capping protein FliD [Aquabacterium sp.]|nr:flagellar filament capping protein FliD [Aquabacterium sp.]